MTTGATGMDVKWGNVKVGPGNIRCSGGSAGLPTSSGGGEAMPEQNECDVRVENPAWLKTMDLACEIDTLRDMVLRVSANQQGESDAHEATEKTVAGLAENGVTAAKRILALEKQVHELRMLAQWEPDLPKPTPSMKDLNLLSRASVPDDRDRLIAGAHGSWNLAEVRVALEAVDEYRRGRT